MSALFYKDQAQRVIADGGKTLPKVSRDLDSVRAYQFEVEFKGEAGDLIYRLAAKQVSPAGMSVEPIEAHRVNDKVKYPGKPSQEELTITFDNLIKDDVAKSLWDWFKRTYDPTTGELGDSDLKINAMSVLQLNHDNSLHSATEYYGVFPVSWKTAEFNYSTNEFHTIEVTFSYDFMEQTAKE